jgi:hypothetical protein
MGFFNAYVNPIALEALAWKYYFLYIGILTAALFVIYFGFPESKGRTLEEISAIFDGDNGGLVGPEAVVVHSLDDKGYNDHLETVDEKVAIGR